MKKLLIACLAVVTIAGGAYAQEPVNSENVKRSIKHSIYLEGGPMIGVGGYYGYPYAQPIQQNGASFTISHGLEFKERFYVGMGIGQELTPDYSYLPVFLDSRLFLTTTKFAPLLYANIGYGFERSGWVFQHPFNLSSVGGVRAGLGGGFQYELTDHIAAVATAGYQFQDLNRSTVLVEPGEGAIQRVDTEYGYIKMNLGLNFSLGFLDCTSGKAMHDPLEAK